MSLPGYSPLRVKTILDPENPNTSIYEALYAMTKEWAQHLLDLGYSPTLPLSYDRETGEVTKTLGELAFGSEDYHETFHFVLNNYVAKDNRIPPYGFTYEEARKRNALPVPADRYRNPDDSSYRYWDEVNLPPPNGATYAEIRLLYQSTSWEYVQFLYLANSGTNPFLAQEGKNLLDAWLNTGMAEPHVMASATWGTPPPSPCTTPGVPQNLTARAGKKSLTLSWQAGSPAPTGGYRIYYTQAGKLQFRAGVGPGTLTYKDSGLTSRMTYASVVTAWNDCNGNGVSATAQ